jgi:RNA polymerase sigma factor (sigma-70 family)
MNTKLYINWVNTYSDRLFGYLIKNGVDRLEAEDMVQNCFEALWKKDLNDEASAGKYLFGVAHNQVADYYKRKSKRSFTDKIPERSTEQHHSDLKQLLNKELANLNPQSRSLILLKDLEGYSYEEIAAITQLSKDQVRVYLHRARLEIKQKLGALEQII